MPSENQWRLLAVSGSGEPVRRQPRRFHRQWSGPRPSQGPAHSCRRPLFSCSSPSVFLIYRSTLYFWAAIVISGAAATNAGDALHDFHVRLVSVPVVCVLLAAMVIAWRAREPFPRGAELHPGDRPLLAHPVGGGACWGRWPATRPPIPSASAISGAVVVCTIPLAFLLVIGRKRPLRRPRLLLARGGVHRRPPATASGDLIAHTLRSIALSTALSGAAFLALIAVAYEVGRGNKRLQMQAAGE